MEASHVKEEQTKDSLCIYQPPSSSSIISSSPAAFLSSSSPSSLHTSITEGGVEEVEVELQDLEKKNEEQKKADEEEKKLRENLSKAEPGTWMFGQEWHAVVEQVNSSLSDLTRFTTDHYTFLKKTRARINATIEAIAEVPCLFCHLFSPVFFFSFFFF